MGKLRVFKSNLRVLSFYFLLGRGVEKRPVFATRTYGGFDTPPSPSREGNWLPLDTKKRGVIDFSDDDKISNCYFVIRIRRIYGLGMGVIIFMRLLRGFVLSNWSYGKGMKGQRARHFSFYMAFCFILFIAKIFVAIHFGWVGRGFQRKKMLYSREFRPKMEGNWGARNRN